MPQFVAFLCMVIVLAACESQQATVVSTDAPQLTDEQTQQMIPGSELLPADSNTARTAAMIVATWRPVSDSRQALEIELHAALYRAAYESNVGDFTRHVLLESATARTGFQITIPERDFRMRVLAKVADLNTPFAWVNPRFGRNSRDGNLFPGTNSLSTRLRVTILERMEDHASVTAEIGDWTSHVGSSRQGVTATWDGLKWDLQRDPVRLFW
jgi:hypothetical protein